MFRFQNNELHWPDKCSQSARSNGLFTSSGRWLTAASSDIEKHAQASTPLILFSNAVRIYKRMCMITLAFMRSILTRMKHAQTLTPYIYMHSIFLRVFFLANETCITLGCMCSLWSTIKQDLQNAPRPTLPFLSQRTFTRFTKYILYEKRARSNWGHSSHRWTFK